MMRSETLTKLIPALIQAKSNFAPAIKDKTNPAFRSGYVSLDGVLEATEDHLMDRGLVVVQTTMVEEGFIRLVTTLFHESGEYLSSVYALRPIKEDPQGYGSAMTYARRYCLMAILGIAPEDDDGNAASGVKDAKQITFKAKGEPVPKPIPLPEKSSAEVNAERVAAGQDPIIDPAEKEAAAASYKILFHMDKDWAKAIKHSGGTDYRKIKIECDKAIKTIEERQINDLESK